MTLNQTVYPNRIALREGKQEALSVEVGALGSVFENQ